MYEPKNLDEFRCVAFKALKWKNDLAGCQDSDEKLQESVDMVAAAVIVKYIDPEAELSQAELDFCSYVVTLIQEYLEATKGNGSSLCQLV